MEERAEEAAVEVAVLERVKVYRKFGIPTNQQAEQ